MEAVAGGYYTPAGVGGGGWWVPRSPAGPSIHWCHSRCRGRPAPADPTSHAKLWISLHIRRGGIQISIQSSHWRKTGQCLLVRQSALPSLHQLPPCLPVLASTCFRLVAHLLFLDTSCHAYPKWPPRPHEPSCNLESVRLGSLTSNFFALRTSQPTPLGLLCLVGCGLPLEPLDIQTFIIFFVILLYRYFRAFSMLWNFSTFWSYWTVSFKLQQFCPRVLNCHYNQI